jgi:hypothetical protein
MKHDAVVMPKKEFVKEHKRLIKLLESGDKKHLRKEGEAQKKELMYYLLGGGKVGK